HILKHLVKKYYNKFKGIKFNITHIGNYYKIDDENLLTQLFSTKLIVGIIFNTKEIQKTLENVYDIIIKKIEHMQQQGSGWLYYNTDSIILNISKHNPLSGSSYIPTPSQLITNKK